jgi:hypothetical protein
VYSPFDFYKYPENNLEINPFYKILTKILTKQKKPPKNPAH